MCHMFADTEEELHFMANKLGLKKKWFQISNSGVPHYDICQSKRKIAINFGAIEINREQVLKIIFRWKSK